LIKIVNETKEEYNEDSLVIYTNCKKILICIMQPQHKANDYIQDTGAILEVIKERINNARISISIEHT